MIKLFHVLRCAGLLSLVLSLVSAGQGADRVLHAQDMSVTRGETNVLHLDLESFGDENALYFSICYDTAYLTFLDAAIGNISNTFPQASFSTDVSQAASEGKVGITLTLDASMSETFPAGLNPIVDLWFVAASGAGSVTTAVSFCDVPITREVSNLTDVVVADYTNATVILEAAVCEYGLSYMATNHGAGMETGLVSVAALEGCEWTAASPVEWVLIDSGASGSGDGSVGYSVLANTNGTERMVELSLAGQTFTLSQAGLDCTYALEPTNGTHGFAAVVGNVSLTTTGACVWAVSNSIDWITFEAAEGAGDSNLTYAVAANPTIVARTGVVAIAGIEFEITQAGAVCEYGLSYMATNHGPGMETGLVSVAALEGCEWTAASPVEWVLIDSGASGSGDGSVGYSVLANTNGTERMVELSLAGQTFTLSQAGLDCTYALEPTNGTHGFAAVVGNVSLTTTGACVWAVSNSIDWITFEAAEGAGDSNLTYAVAANPTIVARTGVVAIAGIEFEITQAGAVCEYGLSYMATNHGPGMETGLVSVAALEGCEWTAASPVEWVLIDSGASGSGDGSVGYSVLANTNGTERMVELSLAGQTFTLSQAGLDCTYALEPTNGTHGFAAVVGNVSLTTTGACVWAVSNSIDWITFEAAEGAGDSNLTYAVAANPTIVARTGVVAIAGIEFEITQAGAVCEYGLSYMATNHGAGMETGLVSVAALEGCEWTAASPVEWVLIDSGASGSGDGSVGYSVLANTNGTERMVELSLAGQTFTLSQAGLDCTYALEPTNGTHGFAAVVGNVSLTTTGACVWAVSNSIDWITFEAAEGAGDSNLTYAVAANPTIVARTGVVAIAGIEFEITQAGAVCEYGLSYMATNHGAGMETGLVSVAALEGCEWTAASPVEWVLIDSGASGSGDGSVGYSVLANTNGTERMVELSLAGQTFTLSQAGLDCTYALEPTNGTHGFAAVVGNVSLTTTGACVWAVSNSIDWITFEAAEGAGDSNLTYAVAANPTIVARTGVVAIAGIEFEITQAGAVCEYGLSYMATNHGAGMETGLVSVAALEGCEWTAASPVEWVLIDSGASGSGDGSVGYSVLANTNGTERMVELSLAGQTFTLSQAGLDCTYALEPTNGTHGFAAVVGNVSLTTTGACVWAVSNSIDWITFEAAEGAGDSNLTYAVAANPTIVARTGVVAIAGIEFEITQAGAVCEYGLSYMATNHGAGMETGLVSVAALEGCEWTAASPVEWVLIDSGASGSGDGSVGYSVLANTNGTERMVELSLAGQTFTLSQAGLDCTYALEPTNAIFSAGNDSGLLYITSLASCAWTVSNSNSWIIIPEGTYIEGGFVPYGVLANPGSLSRTGIVSVAGQEFTVTQAGANCTFLFSPEFTEHGSGGETGEIAVTTFDACMWAVDNTNDWITISSGTNYTNSSSVFYGVLSNATSIARTGIVSIAGQPYLISQVGANCYYTLVPNSQQHTAASQSGMFDIETLIGCEWLVENSTSWIVITSDLHGTNSAPLSYFLTENPAAYSRTGIVTVAGQEFTVIQDGADCAYSIVPTTTSYTAAPATGLVTVTAVTGCPWTVSNTNFWITILSETNNTNSGTVSYMVATNETSMSRTGVVTIAEHNLTIIQTNAPCSFVVSTNFASHGPDDETNSVSVSAWDICEWSTISNDPWIIIESASQLFGNGTATYRVIPNPTALSRTGTVSIAEQTFTIVQSGSDCTFDLSIADAAHGPGDETNSVSVTTLDGCAWSVSNGVPWIVILSATDNTNSGTVTYAVLTNQTALVRTAIVGIADQSFTVQQSGASCTFVLSTNSAAHGAGIETNSVDLLTLEGCSWLVSSGVPWIVVQSPLNNTNAGTVTYNVTANDTSYSRTGVVSIAGIDFTITQAGATCSYVLSSNSISYGPEPHSGAVSLTTLAGCAWNVSSPESWVTITSPLVNTNNGTVSFTVATNMLGAPRVAVLTIGDQTFTIAQDGAPCFMALQLSNWTHRAASEYGVIGIINVPGCSWTVANTNNWITIINGGSGAGSGHVNYFVSSNSNFNERSGYLTVGSIPFLVTQVGTGCVYRLTPASRNHGFGSANNSLVFSNSAGCAGFILNTNDWLSLSSISQGSGASTNYNYHVDSNLGSTRWGVINYGGEIATITQWGTNCGVAPFPRSGAHGPGAESLTVAINVLNGTCAWTLFNTNDWINITSPVSLSGVGASSFTYSVVPNPIGRARMGVFQLNDSFFTVYQAGLPCNFELTPASRLHGTDAESGTVSLSSVEGCSWTIENTNTWIHITSVTNGVGSNTVSYTVDANVVALARAGVVTIAGQSFTVSQPAVSCPVTIVPAGRNHPSGPGAGSFDVTPDSALCSWAVSNPNSWIKILTATINSGSATVQYTVTNNSSSLSRTGTVAVSGQTFTISQDGAPCVYDLNTTNVLHTFALQTATVTNTTLFGCLWNVSTATPWISILSGPTYSGTSNVIYQVASNASSLSRTGSITIGTQTLTVRQSGVPCPGSFSLNPTSRPAQGSGLTTNSVVVQAPIGCTWDVINPNTWISIQSGTSGSGTGTVTYVVQPNVTSSARSGTIVVAGINYVISQAGLPCIGVLTPSSATRVANGESAMVNLAIPTGCAWNVSNPNSWIHFTASSGSGTGNLLYSVDLNPTVIPRTGSVMIADQTFVVRQLGQPCFFNLSSTLGVHGFAPETNSVAVSSTVGCTFTVVNTNSWITNLSGANNTNLFTYAVLTNPLSLTRSAVITVGDKDFTIMQGGITCAYSLLSSNLSIGYDNLTGVGNVLTSGDCQWSVDNTNTWITIKSGETGTNNGTVKFTVAANRFPTPRSGDIIMAGIPFTVTQFGAPCSYSLSATSAVLSSAIETAQVTLSTECGWTIFNTNDWISFNSGTNGEDSALISYTVQANPNFANRVGTFTIENQHFTITQLGAACTYNLPTNSAFHGGLSETGIVSLFRPAGCPYSVVESESWVSIVSNIPGTTNAVIKYALTPNTTGSARTGVIRVGGQVLQNFTIVQASVNCVFDVSPTNRTHGFESETGIVSVNTSNVCPWTVQESLNWVSISGGTSYTGSNSITYIVSANPSSLSRTGVITVAGRSVTITQAGLVCNYTLTPPSLTHPFIASTGQVNIAAPTLCSWAMSRSNTWITLLPPTNGIGTGVVRYAVAPNTTTTPRTTFITIAGQAVPVTQNGMPFILASNKTLNCGISWNFDPPVLAGYCGIPGSTIVVLSTTTNFGCGSSFVAKRIWDATDGCNSHILATQTVSVVTPPPSMICGANKTIGCDDVITFDTPTVIGGCGESNIGLRFTTVVTTSGMCGNTFSVTRTWEATNECGASATCSQTVSVVDMVPPVATCSPNKTVQCGSTWGFDAPTGVDGCSGANVTIKILSTVTNVTGSCGFTATRTWELSDPCTNRTTCVQVVTVVDTVPPVITCIANKSVECGSVWSFNAPSATDNCSGTNVTITTFSTVTNFANPCGNAYTATRTWRATDGCGNFSLCSQIVQVVDTTPPVVSCPGNKTIEFGQAWNFDQPTGNDACGGTNLFYKIVSTTTNTGGFCGNTFSVTRITEVADGCSNKVTCTQVVTVRDTTAPQFLCVPSKTVNCLGAWTFDTPSALDIADGTNVTITVVTSVTNGTCGSSFSATRTWRATDRCGNSSTCSQTVFGRATVNLSGMVYNPTNYPATVTEKRIQGATMMGPTNSSGVTSVDGAYNIVFDAASNVVIRPTAPTSGTPSDGIDSLDILLVRKHILNAGALGSPYKVLAADVDSDGSVSALDLLAMRKVILGATNRFVSGLWRFVPSNFVFTNELMPWLAATNRTYTNVNSDLTGQDFVALKLGDVNNTWGASENLGPAVTFQVNDTTTLPATSVVVNVTLKDFVKVTTAQGTFTWDPAVLRFSQVQLYTLTGLAQANFFTNNVSQGKLPFAWDDPALTGVTVPDGTAMFGVKFDVIGAMGTVSPVTIRDSITRRHTSVNGVAATFVSIDGQVAVTNFLSPRISHVVIGNGAFGLSTPTFPGKKYTLEYSDVIPADHWTPLPFVNGDGTIKILSDPAPSPQKRFYRVKVE